MHPIVKRIRLVSVALVITACAQNPAALPVATPQVIAATAPLVAPANIPLLPADEASRKITLPPGFAIRIFAEGLHDPRFMAFGPDEMLYVTLTDAGQVVRLPDRNNDGRADAVESVATNLKQPHGIEWHTSAELDGGWALYIAEGDKIERWRGDGSGKLNVRELVTTNIPCCGGHFTRTLHFGPDGKLYVSAGSSGNLLVETDPRRAAILRFNQDGTIPSDNPFATNPDLRKRAVWAEGLRNSVDFLWTKNGELWANMNGVDGINDDTPPEAIVIAVQKDRTHGWPFCYTPTLGVNKASQVHDTRVRLPQGFDCAQAIPALFTDLAHSAPLGMALVRGANFPAPYQNDLFVAYHGSWNTNNPSSYRDCKVQRIVIENGIPVRSETFATGWRSPNGMCGDAATWGRPADVIFGPDGAMYVSDDKGGRIYRITFVG
jgi:glucose/arabinose dehydrogenase